MATGNESATFSVVLDDKVSDPAEQAAKAVEQLNEAMAAEEASVKSAAAALRRLKGQTDEVKSAKERLKAVVNAGRDRLSAMTVASLKLADAQKLAEQKAKALAERLKVAKKMKEDAAERARRLGAAVNAAGGPVAGLRDKLGGLTEAFSGAGGGMSVLALGLAGIVAALAAVAAGAVYAGASLAKFVVQGANAARSAALMREAVALDAADGERLGNQIDALSRKLPLAKARIAEMAIELRRNNLAGQPLVDTMNAIGQATAALGDEAGGKLKALVERGRAMQNFSIGDDRWTDDLRGTGLQRDDVAKALAKNMGVGVDKAREALMMGRVKLADGAKALRDAVEKKFSGINVRKMFDLEVIGQKLRERFDTLTQGVNLEPLLHAFESLSSLFDETTVSGAGLKQLVTLFGNDLASAVGASAPLIKQFFKGMIIASLQLAIQFFTLKKRLKETFGDSGMLKGLNGTKIALEAGKAIVTALAVSLILVAGAFAVVGAQIAMAVGLFTSLWEAGENAYEGLKKMSWSEIGFAIADGLTGGLLTGAGKVLGAVKTLGEKVKKGFTDTLQIRSPSKVFEGYGADTVEGYREGVEGKIPEAARALDTMAAKPEGGGSGRAGGRALTLSIPVTINVGAGGDGDVAKQLSSPSFLAQLEKAVENALISAGVPT